VRQSTRVVWTLILRITPRESVKLLTCWVNYAGDGNAVDEATILQMHYKVQKTYYNIIINNIILFFIKIKEFSALYKPLLI
jgi:hypothetical protein